jgi:hypothetical protein
MKKLVMVNTLSIFRIRYAVEVEDDERHALDDVVWNFDNPEYNEFSQKHIENTLVSHRVIDEDEYVRMFDEDNDYGKDWPREKKLKYINVVDYAK